jgi:OHCU decarboxylase
MSPVSTSEQSGAGLTALSPAQRTRLLALTSAYRERFGFPFLFAVKGSTTEGIIAALETRLTGSLESEFAEALRQVHRIAWLRIVGTIGGL